MTPATRTTPDQIVTRLLSLAEDLGWSWREPAQRPFAMLDPVAWEATNHAPIETVIRTSHARIEAAASDPRFLEVLSEAERLLAASRRARHWFPSNHRGRDRRLKVAYYCSEFAIHESMQQYSGGLGVLAGDHVKSADQLGVPLVGVGLLYRHGYYRQQFEADGRQRVLYPTYDFDHYPIEETGVSVACPIGRRTVTARIMRLTLGNTSLLLLDADLPENRPQDRLLTEGLYKGEPDLRMRQQVLLGVGGAMALEAMDEKVTVHHLNEGHAAFAAVERVARIIEDGGDLDSAIEQVRSSTVFTTHTPVPAGHDRYQPKAAAAAMSRVLKRAGLAPRAFADLGRERPGDAVEPLCMTILALRLAAHVNGVAKLHGRVSREMWRNVHPEAKRIDDVPIGSITNGVHPGTWMNPAAEEFWRRTIRLRPEEAQPTEKAWSRATDVDPAEAWDLRNRMRSGLVRFIRDRAVRQATERGCTPDQTLAASRVLREDALTIGFARRFATYKRAPLIFRDRRRLAAILNDPDMPVQLVFAGKAHPRDEGGQAFAKTIFEMSRRPEFRGKVVILEEYDMRIGRELTSGCDVWLNNPIRPHEASGTSGMKPPMHLGINCSILDGWWPEGFDGRNGFAIEGEPKRAGDAARDAADAEALYEILENRLVPEFYKRGRDGVPKRWMKRALRSAATIPSAFSTHRMVADYVEQAYLPANRS
ncbi:MAG: alpha-glucan phosphorylase [Phycisphaerae bacterium]|nr:alpha-glucan phosphorylase [Phycisphaerae bacterium]